MLILENIYNIGEIVYLKTDSDQHARVVTAIKIFPNNEMMYELSCGERSSLHYEFEISKEKELINNQ